MAFIPLLCWGCYNDDDLRNSLEELQSRVEKLEKASEQIKSDIASLQTIVAKLEQQVTVNSVVQTSDGYTINFSDGTTATISNGTDGINPPQVVVEQFEGRYYWAYRDAQGQITFITDKNNAKIPVTEPAPKVRINPQTFIWEISEDDGATWTSTGVKALGEDAQAFFQEVREDDDYVYFTLSGGSVIKIAKSKELSLTIEAEGMLYFAAGQTRQVKYTESGVTRKSVSKPDGWKVAFAGGNIEITAPAAENPYAEVEGTISIVAVGPTGQSTIAEIQVTIGTPTDVGLKVVWAQGDKFFTDIHFGDAGETDAEELKPSNTFLVRPAKKYRFRTDIMGRGSKGVEALGLNAPTQQLGGFDIRQDASISKELKGEHEYIYFTVNDYGDAAAGSIGVVAVTLNDQVAWSWTIWSRASDPADEQIGEHTFMDVNLCSHGPHQIKVKLGHSEFYYPYAYYYGLPYSWGMNTPLPGLSTQGKAVGAMWLKPETMWYVYEYDQNGSPAEVTTRRPGYSTGLAEAVKTPFAPALLASDGADPYTNIWGHTSGEKTIFDPCPYGYRVPTDELFRSMTFGLFGKGGLPYNNTVAGKSGYLMWGNLLTVHPDSNTPLYPEENDLGYYWTNSPSAGATVDDPDAQIGGDYAQIFRFKEKTKVTFTTTKRNNGALIRCIRYAGEV